jgi:ABC-type transport system involved in multi-copper enzyme maturation permease subunit
VQKQFFREPLGRMVLRRISPGAPSSRKSRGPLRRNPVLWLYFTRSRFRWVTQGVAGLALLAALLWAYVHEPTNTLDEGYLVAMYYGGMLGTFCLKILILLYVARSFVVEKEDGSLELLLTTPTTNHQIVHSKLLAVLGHYGILFFLAFALMTAGAFRMGAVTGMSGMNGMSYYFLSGVVTTLSSTISLVLVCLLISAWSKTATQAITLSIVGTILLSWLLGTVTSTAMMVMGFGLAFAQQKGISMMLSQGAIMGGRVLVDATIAFIAYRLLINNVRKYATR